MLGGCYTLYQDRYKVQVYHTLDFLVVGLHEQLAQDDCPFVFFNSRKLVKLGLHVFIFEELGCHLKVGI